MPGIFGVLTLAPDRDPRAAEIDETLRTMSSAMSYEPWYVTQLVSCPTLGVAGGRVGFGPAIETRAARRQPALVVAVVTGEPMGTPDASGDFEDGSAEAIGIGAHEVLRAYLRSGVAGLKELEGNFAGLLIDRRSGRCLVFNDRYGRERLFVHSDQGRLMFASEAKAILAAVPRTRAFDATGLSEWLGCGSTLGTRSLFHEIDVLEGGTVITTGRNERARRERYFDLASWEQLATVTTREFLDGFSASLCAAVDRSVKSSSSIALSLTGGLDSRMIAASLDAPRDSVPCYTFGSMYRATADVAVARQVAASCGRSHQVLVLGQEFLAGIGQTLDEAVYISDGCIGLSGAAELHLNREARSIAAARMTGNWGGELMRGVRAFKYTVPNGYIADDSLLRQMKDSASAFDSATKSHPMSYTLGQQMPCQGYGRYAIERSQLMTRSPFLTNDVVMWLYRAAASFRGSSDCFSAVIGRRPELLAIPTDIGALGRGPAAAAFVRRLYRRGVAKAEYLTSHGAPHWLANLSASLPRQLIEQRFLGRDKFQHFRLWMRHQLAELVRDTLLTNRAGELDAWFDMRRVAAMVAAHVDGRANYTEQIDKLMTLAVAQRTLLSGAVRRPGHPIAQAISC